MPPYRDGASPGSKGGRERIRLFRVQPARGTLRSKTGAAVSKDVRRWSLVGLPFPAPPLSRSYRKFRHVIVRSEEHTSELQSLMRISYAVFCLKKKLNNRKIHIYELHGNSIVYDTIIRVFVRIDI